MRITLDSRKMEELMKAFYTMAGIRFVLFDANHREIAAYPAESCAFCTAMKSCPRTRRRCVGADKRALKKCSESGSVVVYNCHAGLVEAAVPIFDNEQIVAYLMFGQVRDRAHDKTRKLLPEVAGAVRHAAGGAADPAGQDRDQGHGADHLGSQDHGGMRQLYCVQGDDHPAE